MYAQELRNLVITFVIATTAVFVASSISRRRTVGLTLAYAMNFAVNYLFGAIAYLVPTYVTENNDYVLLGFRQSTAGMVAFAVGAVVLSPFLVAAAAPSWRKIEPCVPDPRLPKAYLAIGFTFYFILWPVMQSIPSIGTLGASGWSLMIAGTCLAAWSAWIHHRGHILRWILLGMVFPVITVVHAGFLSYGIAAVIIILSFVSCFYRPRWKIVVGGLIAVYLGLSLFVTYFRDRNELREAVWYEDASYGARFAQLGKTMSKFELFNPNNENHLGFIDGRLNQNVLVGRSVEYLESGTVPYAQGETLWEAVIAFVPRILWPDKPVTAGSGNYVAEYTGLEFAEGTSVGLGQVLEFYINFGTPCVIAGFLVLGAFVAFIDKAAGARLAKGDWQGCIFWFLPGVALLQAAGSLVEVTSGFAASIVFCHLVNKYVLPRITGKPITWRRLLRAFTKKQKEAA